jgi:hypothetical protein
MITQVTYISTVSPDVGPDDIEAILTIARRNNRHRDLTGLLLFNGKRFLQHLEGPTLDVERIYSNIVADPRHRALVELGRVTTDYRSFSGWQMAFHHSRQMGGLAQPSLHDQVEMLVGDVDPLIADHFRYFAAQYQEQQAA